jgi:transposase-like protein
MATIRKTFGKEFKAKVAFEALKGDKTTAELSSEHGVHATQIAQWKKELREKLPSLFASKADPEGKQKEKLIDNLYKEIGELQVENNWLKKSCRFES